MKDADGTLVSDSIFPFYLVHTFEEDNSSSILSIDINSALNLFVTASRNGNLTVREMGSKENKNIIPLNKLSEEGAELLFLKLSRYGYIIVLFNVG